MIDLLSFAKKHFEKKLPFVVFSKPNLDKIVGLFQKNDELYSVENFEESGFVFASFDGNRQVLIPENQSEIKITDFVFEENNSNNFPVLENEKGKEAFENLVQKGIDAIRNGSFQKVVLSRKEIVAIEDFDFAVIFERLLQTYPTAFKYCWFHPKVGMWIGATPEQLLKSDGLKINTVALAGTQKVEENKDVIWGEKEIEEQEFVTDFIVDNLKDIASELSISKPYTLKAGAILHIKTDIEAVLKPENNLKKVLEILHPTPAVCGLPKPVSREFILRNEGYDREFYSGFLGELNKAFVTSETKSDLFVNLRCMQVKENEAHLYIGCGVTKDSVPEKEFVETANKALTMKRILL
ncbi:isochorismate synthase [Flavobacterium arsenatis]|uniref:isochorismate synthase n=1 Tax=Flavobacterium arsenatis TaxID=1484332 RepID=A0ABU1TU38_9FLAO|nr:isochorismate synthase [Flavobacterium arsenatis]MDR6969332.1 isochorismate synthase [Flavobacterium arsenatis]